MPLEPPGPFPDTPNHASASPGHAPGGPGERRRLLHNVASLYGVQVANYVVPLAIIPYLTRVLGASGWGLVAFAQAFAMYVLLVGDYGFALSATRDVARHRTEPGALGRLLGDVMAAKALLAVGTLVLAAGVQQIVPGFRGDPKLFWGATAWGLAQTFSMLWYFQGLERIRLVAGLEVTAKVAGAVGVFVVVRGPADAWKVLSVQAVPHGLVALVGWLIARSEVPVSHLTLAGARAALAGGRSLFFFRGAVSLYTSANAFILGLFAPPAAVGYYAAGEKLAKASLGLVGPISQALYPRLSHLARAATERAARLLQRSLFGMGGVGLGLGIGLFTFAPDIVRVVLGPDFGPAVPVLRLLALLPPLIAVSNVLGIQWMLPLGMDSTVNRIIIAAGVLNVGLAFALAPVLQHTGMAVAVVCTEGTVTVLMYLVLHRRGLMPYSAQFRDPSPSHEP